MKASDPGLIDRDIHKKVPDLGMMKETLERTANYGTHLISKCGEESQGQDVSSIILLGIHAIKMIDSISVLVGVCCIESAQILVRSLMEATFGLMYMALGDHERKSRQYIVAHAHKQIDLYEKFDPNTQAGKQFLTRAKGRSVGDPSEFARFDTTAEVNNLRNLLKRPEYAPIEAEWIKCKKNKGQLWWYSLFGGPKTIENLADQVGNRDVYDILYRSQSGEVHATNALRGIHQTKNAQQVFQPIRYPIQAPQTTSISIGLALNAYRSLIGTLAPTQNDNLKIWFDRQIKQNYQAICRLKYTDADRQSKLPKTRR